MFKIVQTDGYNWPVEVKIPADGGRFETASFDVKFKRMQRSRVEALREEFSKPDGDSAAVAREVVIGWNGVEDDSGAIPFSAGALDKVLEIQGVAPAIVGSFFSSAYGVERKN
jgi:hypothetical protein